MPKMTNTKSADVLNGSDSFEDRLNWVLFKQEQDARLWSGLEMEGTKQWVPGDPMYSKPERGRFPEFEFPSEGFMIDPDDYWINISDFDENGVRGNYYRPLFEIFSDVYREVRDPDNLGYWKMELKRDYRCAECEVHWWGDEPCFVCGVERPGPGSQKARMETMPIPQPYQSDCNCELCQFARGELSGEELEVALGLRTGVYNDVVSYSRADIALVQQMLPPMRRMFTEVMTEMAQTAQRVRPVLQRFGTALGEEVERQIRSGMPTPNEIRRQLGMPPLEEAVVAEPVRGARPYLTIFDEWTAAERSEEVEVNGVTIPRRFPTEPTPPLPEVIIMPSTFEDRFRDIFGLHLPPPPDRLEIARRQRTYPTSAPEWSRRRPRYE
jgi:hypothetical protein